MQTRFNHVASPLSFSESCKFSSCVCVCECVRVCMCVWVRSVTSLWNEKGPGLRCYQSFHTSRNHKPTNSKSCADWERNWLKLCWSADKPRGGVLTQGAQRWLQEDPSLVFSCTPLCTLCWILLTEIVGEDPLERSIHAEDVEGMCSSFIRAEEDWL